MIASNLNIEYWWASAQGLYDQSIGGLSAIEGATVYARSLVTTTYTLTAIDRTHGREGYFSLNTIVVEPAYYLTISGDDFYCAGNHSTTGDAIDLTAYPSGAGFSGYTWYNESEHVTYSNNTNHLGLSSTDAEYPHGNSVISVSGTFGPGCPVKAVFYIQVAPNLQVYFPKPVICEGENIMVTASGAESKYNDLQETHNLPGDYTWLPSDSILVNDDDNSHATTNVVTVNTYTVSGGIDSNAKTGTNGNCPGSSSTMEFSIGVAGTTTFTNSITATPPPNNNSPYPLFEGESVELEASNSQTNTYFTWYPSSGLNLVTGPTVVASPCLFETDAGEITYYVLSETTDSNPYGCCNTKSKKIAVSEYEPVFSCDSDCDQFCMGSGHPYLSVSPVLHSSSAFPVTYQWYKGGSLITGATGSEYDEQITSSASYKLVITTHCKTYTHFFHAIVTNDPCRIEESEIDTFKTEHSISLVCYPNPASDEVYISITGNKNYEDGTLQIFNSVGIKVIESTADISSNYNKLIKEKWVDGVYIVVLNTGKEIIKQSVTIQH